MFTDFGIENPSYRPHITVYLIQGVPTPGIRGVRLMECPLIGVLTVKALGVLNILFKKEVFDVKFNQVK